MRKAELPALVVAVLFFAPAAFAQGWRDLPAGKWWKNPQVVQDLKLSEDQQKRIEAVWAQNRRELIEQKAELDRRRLELSELLTHDTVDEGAALKLFDQVQAARLAIERSMFTMRVRIKNLLRPDQQQRLEELSTRFRRFRNGRPGLGSELPDSPK